MALTLAENYMRLVIEPEGQEPDDALREERIQLGWERYADLYREHGLRARNHLSAMVTQACVTCRATPIPFVVLYQTGRLSDAEWSDAVTWLAIALTKQEAKQACLRCGSGPLPPDAQKAPVLS